MLRQPEYPILTSRLALRPLTSADTDDLLAYRSVPGVCRYVPFEPMDAADIRSRLDGMWANRELTDEGQALTLGLELAGRVIGDTVLFWHSAVHLSGEIGYVLNPKFGGHGYATEAAREVLRLGFEGLGLRRIVARIDARNAASVGVVSRLGMRREAHLVQNEFFKGEWTDELVFAMLTDEWQTRAAPEHQ